MKLGLGDRSESELVPVPEPDRRRNLVEGKSPEESRLKDKGMIITRCAAVSKTERPCQICLVWLLEVYYFGRKSPSDELG